jgi:hypothetical protein
MVVWDSSPEAPHPHSVAALIASANGTDARPHLITTTSR